MGKTRHTAQPCQTCSRMTGVSLRMATGWQGHTRQRLVWPRTLAAAARQRPACGSPRLLRPDGLAVPVFGQV